MRTVRLGPLAGVTAVLLDLDGCTWFGGRLADGAAAFVEALRQAGVPVGFLTNASIATGATFADMLRSAGLPCPDGSLLAPIDVLLDGVERDLTDAQLRRGDRALVLARDPIRAALDAAGVRTVTPRETGGATPAVAAVVVGRDARDGYAAWTVATRALRAGARGIALNGDARIPAEDGQVVPGPGAITAALSVASGVNFQVLGKPDPAYFAAALRRFGMQRSGAVMIGDNPFTDVAGGRAAGLRTIRVEVGTFPESVALDGTHVPEADLTVPSLRALLEQVAAD